MLLEQLVCHVNYARAFGFLKQANGVQSEKPAISWNLAGLGSNKILKSRSRDLKWANFFTVRPIKRR